MGDRRHHGRPGGYSWQSRSCLRRVRRDRIIRSSIAALGATRVASASGDAVVIIESVVAAEVIGRRGWGRTASGWTTRREPPRAQFRRCAPACVLLRRGDRVGSGDRLGGRGRVILGIGGELTVGQLTRSCSSALSSCRSRSRRGVNELRTRRRMARVPRRAGPRPAVPPASLARTSGGPIDVRFALVHFSIRTPTVGSAGGAHEWTCDRGEYAGRRRRGDRWARPSSAAAHPLMDPPSGTSALRLTRPASGSPRCAGASTRTADGFLSTPRCDNVASPAPSVR